MIKNVNDALNEFEFADLPVVNKKVFRMGIAGNYGIDCFSMGAVN